MEIKNYKYIAHKLVERPWGVECRFTVRTMDGRELNDIAMVESLKLDEKELAIEIEKRLLASDLPPLDVVVSVVYTESEVKALLVEKGFLVEGESLANLKTKDELIMEAKAVVEVKP